MPETAAQMQSRSVAGAHRVGPRSRPHVLLKLDRRTKEAALMKRTREELLAHVGGAPTAVQAALIERIVMLTLHVALFDRKAVQAGGLSARDGREYLAYSNSLSRCLRQLGLKSAPPRPPTLDEALAEGRTSA